MLQSDIKQILQNLRQHQNELPLRELCKSCLAAIVKTTATLDLEEGGYEPSIWFFDPSPNADLESVKNSLFIAYQPDYRLYGRIFIHNVRDNKMSEVERETTPSQPVLVIRLKNTIPIEKEINELNTLLQQTGLQETFVSSTESSIQPLITRLEEIRADANWTSLCLWSSTESMV